MRFCRKQIETLFAFFSSLENRDSLWRLNFNSFTDFTPCLLLSLSAKKREEKSLLSIHETENT